MLALPESAFPAYERVHVRVGKTPYVRFDSNDYSVPEAFVRKTLLVVADMKTVRIFDGSEEVGSHTRSWERDKQIEAPAHVRNLEKQKLRGREHRNIDRLYHSAPDLLKFLSVASSDENERHRLSAFLLRLTELCGPVAIESALEATRTIEANTVGPMA